MAKRGKVIGYAIQTGSRITVKEFAKMRKTKRKGKKRATPRQLAALRRARAAMCATYGTTPRKRKTTKRKAAPKRRTATKRRTSGLRARSAYPHLSAKQYANLKRMQAARRRRR